MSTRLNRFAGIIERAKRRVISLKKVNENLVF